MGTPASQVFAPNATAQQAQDLNAGPKDWYTYLAPFTAVTVSVPQSYTITIEQDSNFWMTAIQYFVGQNDATPDEGSLIIPEILLQVTDSGSSRNMFSQPVPLSSVAGTGERPHYLRHPRLVRKSSSLQVQIVSYDATTSPYDFVYIVFEGYKVYN